MAEIILRKPVTYSDLRRHTLSVPATIFDRDSSVKVIAGNESYRVDVDSFMRLRLGSRIFDKLGFDKVGDIIVIEELSKGSYRVSREKTQQLRWNEGKSSMRS